MLVTVRLPCVTPGYQRSSRGDSSTAMWMAVLRTAPRPRAVPLLRRACPSRLRGTLRAPLGTNPWSCLDIAGWCSPARVPLGREPVSAFPGTRPQVCGRVDAGEVLTDRGHRGQSDGDQGR